MVKIQFIFLVVLSLNIQATETSYSFNKSISAIEENISGRLGVAVLNIKNNEMWSYRGNERFPLMSTFKALACAKMFNDIEVEKLDKNSLSTINKEDLITWSPVTKKIIGQKISVFDACEATMLTSDNTAANIVLEHIGGAVALTKYLRDIGDPLTRLDRIEPELNTAVVGDVRDTTTPRAMVNTLNKILSSELLSSNSSKQLKLWMQNNCIFSPIMINNSCPS